MYVFPMTGIKALQQCKTPRVTSKNLDGEARQ